MNSRSKLKELDLVDRYLASTVHTIDLENPGVDGRYADIPKLPKIQVEDDLVHNTHIVMLNESSEFARLTKIRLCDVDAESLVLKPDNFWIQYFADKTWGKACDYLVLTVHNKVKYAIFIDLKTKIAEQPKSENYDELTYESDFNKGIVWQMIGADAFLDGMVDVLQKRTLKACADTSTNKRLAAGHELAKYRRRYLVLYRSVDAQLQSIHPTKVSLVPNAYSLEKPIRTYCVSNGSNISIGALFTNVLDV